MLQLKNENGLTLIETIAGVVLIFVVLISFVQFFANAATFNSVNHTNIQASNVAREYTVNVTDIYTGLTLQELQSNYHFIKETDPLTGKGFYKLTSQKEQYIIETVIYDQIDSTNAYRALRPAKISVWKEKIEGKPVSESFTYHEGEVLNR